MIDQLGLRPYNHPKVEGVADLMLPLLHPTDGWGCVSRVPRRNAITK